jgi:hypothetical protein
MSETEFTGASLEQALKEQSLSSSGTTLTGMVKASEKSGHIGFTQTGCETWIDLPTGMIERAERLGERPCKEHTHPLMRLTLKNAKDPHQQILLALLAQTAQATQPTSGMPDAAWALQGQTPLNPYGLNPYGFGSQVPSTLGRRVGGGGIGLGYGGSFGFWCGAGCSIAFAACAAGCTAAGPFAAPCAAACSALYKACIDSCPNALMRDIV